MELDCAWYIQRFPEMMRITFLSAPTLTTYLNCLHMRHVQRSMAQEVAQNQTVIHLIAQHCKCMSSVSIGIRLCSSSCSQTKLYAGLWEMLSHVPSLITNHQVLPHLISSCDYCILRSLGCFRQFWLCGLVVQVRSQQLKPWGRCHLYWKQRTSVAGSTASAAVMAGICSSILSSCSVMWISLSPSTSGCWSASIVSCEASLLVYAVAL